MRQAGKKKEWGGLRRGTGTRDKVREVRRREEWRTEKAGEARYGAGQTDRVGKAAKRNR